MGGGGFVFDVECGSPALIPKLKKFPKCRLAFLQHAPYTPRYTADRLNRHCVAVSYTPDTLSGVMYVHL